MIALDKSARDSIQNFESGNGNVAITYENEVYTAKEAGLPDEAVVPALDHPDPEPGRGGRRERGQALRASTSRTRS